MARQQPEVNRAFGGVLRDFRTRRGLTQEALAAACELHVTYISQLERGLKSPSLTTLVLLGQALGTTGARLVQKAEEAAGARQVGGRATERRPSS